MGNNAIAKLETLGLSVSVVIIWVQGESDLYNDDYASDEAAMFSSLDSDLDAPVSKIINVLHSDNQTAYPLVRRQFINACKISNAVSDARIQTVNTDGLTFYSDNIHYNTSGMLGLGNRVFEALGLSIMSKGFASLDGTVTGGRYQGLEPISGDYTTFLSDAEYRTVLEIRAATRNDAPTYPNYFKFLELCGVTATLDVTNPRLILVLVASALPARTKWLIETLIPLAAGKQCRVEVA
jgi:hypothetical protein